jgi:hypothetical protein
LSRARKLLRKKIGHKTDTVRKSYLKNNIEGNTSSQEELQLKAYFKSDTWAADHEMYRSLFHSFEIVSY